jgi:VIT1/CCC1 family predicted Fe2+/Mn2+ transporter
MKASIKKGFSFGLTSGIITTLGVIIGLNSSTHSKTIITGGIITVAIADALSDATGIHFSEESEGKNSSKEIWESTISTFIFKLIFALTLLVPILFFSLSTAIIIDIAWGLFLITSFSYYLAKKQKIMPVKVILEHLTIAVIVIIATHFVGNWVATFS